jgi:putative DNA primase/helicase
MSKADFTHEIRDLGRQIDDVGSTTTPPDQTANVYNLTDVGNGAAFAAQHEGEVLYVRPWGWRVYDHATGVWRDDDGALMRLAKATARHWNAVAADTDDDNRRQAIQKHARASESARALRAMLEMAQSELAVHAEPQDFDSHLMAMNTPNGVIDLATGELRKHSPDLRLTKLAGAPYEPDAECPLWQAHLERIFAGDAELIDFVQRLFGYCLTGRTSEQIMAIFWGTGANGKSVTDEALRAAMGDYAAAADFRSFTVTKSEGPRNDLARLDGARIVTASEGNSGARLDEGLVKQATGGEPLTVRFLHQEHFEYRPQFKLILLTNHKPEIRGADTGIWRRVRLVPFTVTIPDDEQDHDLPEKLHDELSGILAWTVRGCLAWQKRGLDPPEAVREATAGYRAEMDVIATFLAECCVVDDLASLPVAHLYHAYQQWAKRSGEYELSSRRFVASLRDHSVKLDGREGGTGRTLCWGYLLASFTNEGES